MAETRKRSRRPGRRTAACLVFRAVAAGACLADAAPASGAADRTAVEAEVEEIRGLAFLSPVVYRTMAPEELGPFLERKIDEEIGSRTVGRYERSLAYLGLLPDGVDLRSAYLALMQEQIGAFFDPDSRILYLLDGVSYGESIDRAMLAHELTHALQDQHFTLADLPLRVQGDDDRVLAAVAVVEGDAMRVMQKVVERHAGLSSLWDNLQFMATAQTETLSAAPLFLRESLLFPYVEGRRFMDALAARGDDAVNAAFREPPCSSETILHPERYLDHGSSRLDVALPHWRRDDRQLVWANTLGEFGVRVWLTRWNGVGRGAGPADGWEGDRYEYYEDDRGRPRGLVWVTAWETPDDADEFAAAAGEALARRVGALARDERPGGDAVLVRQWLSGSHGVARVELRERCVSVVMAGSLGEGADLQRLAASGMRSLAP